MTVSRGDLREMNRRLGIPRRHRIEPADVMFVVVAAAAIAVLIANLR